MIARYYLLYIGLVVLLVSAGLGYSWEPDRVYWVELEVREDAEEASALLGELEAEGFGPLMVYPSAGGPSVRLGEFATYMDAFLVFQDIQGDFNDATVRYNSLEAEQDAGRMYSFTKAMNPRPSSRRLLTGAPSALVVRQVGSGESTAAQIDFTMIPIGSGGAWTLANSRARLESTGFDFARAQRAVTAKDFARVRSELLPIIKGDLEVSDQEYLIAAWFLARTYHAMDWRRTSYRMYRELLELELLAPEDRAIAYTELMGLVIELSYAGSGRREEARAIFGEFQDKLANDFHLPEVQKQYQKAVLMVFELYYLNQENAQALDFFREHLELIAHPDYPSVAATGCLFAGEVAIRMGDNELAELLLEQSLSYFPVGEDFWPSAIGHSKRAYQMLYQTKVFLGRPPSEVADLVLKALKAHPGGGLEEFFLSHLGRANQNFTEAIIESNEELKARVVLWRISDSVEKERIWK